MPYGTGPLGPPGRAPCRGTRTPAAVDAGSGFDRVRLVPSNRTLACALLRCCDSSSDPSPPMLCCMLRGCLVLALIAASLSVFVSAPLFSHASGQARHCIDKGSHHRLEPLWLQPEKLVAHVCLCGDAARPVCLPHYLTSGSLCIFWERPLASQLWLLLGRKHMHVMHKCTALEPMGSPCFSQTKRLINGSANASELSMIIDCNTVVSPTRSSSVGCQADPFGGHLGWRAG